MNKVIPFEIRDNVWNGQQMAQFIDNDLIPLLDSFLHKDSPLLPSPLSPLSPRAKRRRTQTKVQHTIETKRDIIEVTSDNDEEPVEPIVEEPIVDEPIVDEPAMEESMEIVEEGDEEPSTSSEDVDTVEPVEPLETVEETVETVEKTQDIQENKEDPIMKPITTQESMAVCFFFISFYSFIHVCIRHNKPPWPFYKFKEILPRKGNWSLQTPKPKPKPTKKKPLLMP